MRKLLFPFIAVLGYLLFGIAVVAYTGQLGNIMFVWNVFLAYLPFLFVQILYSCRQNNQPKKGVVILLSLLWLIFFPNAPYMVTDLMYFSGLDGTMYSVYFWVKLLYISSGMLVAALFGLNSLYGMHQLVLRRKGRLYGSFFLAAVSLLSGFGIYLGRMLRFNSWDVLRPFVLLSSIADQLDRFAVLFSLIFAAYIAGTYIVYYLITHYGQSPPGGS